MTRRVLVLGHGARAVLGVACLLAAVAFYYLGDQVTAAALVAAFVSRIVPVERGRPGDTVRFVTRGSGPPARRRASSLSQPLPLPPPDDDVDEHRDHEQRKRR